jgi:hypothetical protein
MLHPGVHMQAAAAFTDERREAEAHVLELAAVEDEAFVAGHPDPFGGDMGGVYDDDNGAPCVPLPESGSGSERPPAEPDLPAPTWVPAYETSDEESTDAEDPRVRSALGMHVYMKLETAASARCMASEFFGRKYSHVHVRGRDSSSSDGDGDAAEDDIDNAVVLNMLVAHFAQHEQMAAQHAEHEGDAPMLPIVHAPDAAYHEEPQQSPRPETLAWYLHHFDDPTYPGAARTTVQVAYKALHFKVAGKVPDKVFDDVCRERSEEHSAGNTYPKHLSPLQPLHHCVVHGCRPVYNNRCGGSRKLACHMNAIDASFTPVTFVCA